jgi:hypothetical protein
MSASAVPTEASSSNGKPVSTSSASSTAASPRTPSASACPSATRTTPPWSSGRPVSDPGRIERPPDHARPLGCLAVLAVSCLRCVDYP